MIKICITIIYLILLTQKYVNWKIRSEHAKEKFISWGKFTFLLLVRSYFFKNIKYNSLTLSCTAFHKKIVYKRNFSAM